MKAFFLLLLIIPCHLYSQVHIDSIRKIEITDVLYKGVELKPVYGFRQPIAIELDLDYSGNKFKIENQNLEWVIYDMHLLEGPVIMDRIKKEDIDKYKQLQSLIPDSISKFSEEIKKYHKLYYSKPTKIGKVSKDKIVQLLNELKRIPSHSVFKELGYTLDIYQEKSSEYLNKYLSLADQRDLNEEKKVFCLKQLNKKHLINKEAKKIIRTHALCENNTIIMKIITSSDTITYKTGGSGTFMLPWLITNYNGYRYNPNISLQVGELLPDGLSKQKLLGKNFEEEVYFEMIEEYCLNNRGRFRKK